jgi:hypothetical protein
VELVRLWWMPNGRIRGRRKDALPLRCVVCRQLFTSRDKWAHRVTEWYGKRVRKYRHESCARRVNLL